ncbi:hypothetical protein ACS0TY_024988 [Phlomoides rotata]
MSPWIISLIISLDKKESWDLLLESPALRPHFKDAEKKIAKKCDGLPLTNFTVVDLLSKVPESLWIDVATKRKHKLFIDAYDQISQLITLLDVATRSGMVLSRVPNLKKLGIKIELAPDAADPLYCIDHISHLTNLESLKCVIVNPAFKLGVVSPVLSFPCFLFSLKKLGLSGKGYPWKEMRNVTSLPNLEVLKL